MAYQKVPRPSTVYHLTKKEHLDSILDDGVIRRFDDTECWFCESLDKMRAYMAQTVLCEGKSYYAVGGLLCRYPKFVPEDYVLLKLTPRGYEDNWYRWNQEVPPGSSKELLQAAKEFSMLKIGYRGDMAFKEPEVIDVPKFLSGEIVSHKELTSSEMWGLIFERTEAEMAAYMRGLDQLERDELIQSAAEISAMQVCRGRLTEEHTNHEKGNCHDPIRERAACRSRIFAQKEKHQRAGAAGGTAQMSLRIRGAGAGAGISRQPRGARCPSPPSGKTGEAAAAGGASLCAGVT